MRTSSSRKWNFKEIRSRLEAFGKSAINEASVRLGERLRFDILSRNLRDSAVRRLEWVQGKTVAEVPAGSPPG